VQWQTMTFEGSASAEKLMLPQWQRPWIFMKSPC